MKNALTVPQKTLTLLLCLFMTVSVLGGCGRREPFVRTLFALDTVVSVTYYDSRDAEAIAKIPERLEYYEGIFSRTRQGSELYEINARLAEAAAEGLTDVRLPLSLEMYQALSLALEYARLTDGAFDPTLGRLSELYNFSGSQHTVPSEAQRTEILSHCGYEKLRVENAPASAWPWHLTVEDPAIVIDLGGMAKGYIADRLKEELLAEGVTGAILNLILDPILIFGLLGMPKLGIRGAAIATVIGQIVAAILACVMNFKKNTEIHIRLKGFRPDAALIGQIYRIGVPSIIMQSIGSVMVYIMNKVLIGFSSTAVAVFGVYFKLQSFIFMPIFGMNNGLIPIIAYNYGAGKRERMMQTWRFAWALSTVIMLFGVVAFEVFPVPLLEIFEASDEMMSIGKVALRVIGVHFPVAAYCIVTGSMFRALGMSIYSMITSIMRQVVVLIPAAILLAQLGNVDYVWWSFPIAEIMSAAATTFFFNKIYKDIIRHVGTKEEILQDA